MSTVDSDVQDLYREVVLDHAQHPRNFGPLPNATHSADGINPLCGDKLHLYLAIDGQDRVQTIKFEGSGCAISMASASLLTEALVSHPVEEVVACAATVTARLSGDLTQGAPSGINIDKLRALEGVRQYPSRIKCATLAWQALNAAIANQHSPASTE